MDDALSIAGLLPDACDWCPRACGADRAHGGVGACGADDTVRVARSALHFWEEPCISGASGSGTIFFSNCPLRCVYCQNADIAQGRAGKAVSPGRLVEMMLELQDAGALNINMVTPTHYAPLIRVAIEAARERGLALPIVWNTSGYETVESIRALAGCVDIYLTDFKYARSQTAADYSHAPDYPQVALAALDAMVEQVGRPVFGAVAPGEDDAARDAAGGGDAPAESAGPESPMRSGVIVRHLLLPGHLEESAEAIALIHGRYGDAVRLSIMNQYTPIIAPDSAAAQRFPELLQRVPDGEYEALLAFADELGVQDYYWQDGPAALESFIPAFDLTGV